LYHARSAGYAAAMTSSPFDDIRALIAQAPPPNPLKRPAPADLGDIANLADWITAWRGRARVARPILALYAGAHAGGDIAETRAFLEAVSAGDAAISRAAQHLGAGLDVFDLALDRPLPSAAGGPTMSERECAATMAFGMEVLAKQPDLLILVGVGPGADAAATAVIEALTPGTDALEALRRWGGRETAAVAGAIIGARSQNIPVLLDGLPALAAAAVFHAVEPSAIAHCRLAGSVWAGPALAGLTPLTTLGIVRSDGTAALAALCLITLAGAMVEAA
jgi:nicotinate-nucleotide--dimethylbenzimidazole phosphoribosyltransferase